MGEEWGFEWISGKLAATYYHGPMSKDETDNGLARYIIFSQ